MSGSVKLQAQCAALRRDEAVTSIEYALLAAVMTVALAAGAELIGQALTRFFLTIGSWSFW